MSNGSRSWGHTAAEVTQTQVRGKAQGDGCHGCVKCQGPCKHNIDRGMVPTQPCNDGTEGGEGKTEKRGSIRLARDGCVNGIDE